MKNIAKKFDEVTLSTGVVLGIKKIPRLLIGELVKVPRPTPPIVMIESIGREEENPADPEYINKVQQWETMVSMKMVDAFVLFGTNIKSVPDGFPDFLDSSISSKLKALGIITISPEDKYLAWIKFFACEQDEDIAAVIDSVGRLSGVSEKDVDEAVNKFRSNTK
jgi:hypothetical protein